MVVSPISDGGDIYIYIYIYIYIFIQNLPLISTHDFKLTDSINIFLFPET